MAKIKTQVYMTPELVSFQLHDSFEGRRHCNTHIAEKWLRNSICGGQNEAYVEPFEYLFL